MYVCIYTHVRKKNRRSEYRRNRNTSTWKALPRVKWKARRGDSENVWKQKRGSEN